MHIYKRLEIIYTSQVHLQDMHHMNIVQAFKTINTFIFRLAVSDCSSKNLSYLFISATKYNKTSSWSCLDPLIQLFNTTERSARQILIQFFFFKIGGVHITRLKYWGPRYEPLHWYNNKIHVYAFISRAVCPLICIEQKIK